MISKLYREKMDITFRSLFGDIPIFYNSDIHVDEIIMDNFFYFIYNPNLQNNLKVGKKMASGGNR